MSYVSISLLYTCGFIQPVVLWPYGIQFFFGVSYLGLCHHHLFVKHRILLDCFHYSKHLRCMSKFFLNPCTPVHSYSLCATLLLSVLNNFINLSTYSSLQFPLQKQFCTLLQRLTCPCPKMNFVAFFPVLFNLLLC